jgi:xanthine dehydrogenase accessory factor
MDLSSLKALNLARRERKAVVHVLDLDTGASRVVLEDEAVDGALRHSVGDVIRRREASTVQANGRLFFLNPYLPPIGIVIIGAVHISQALVAIAGQAGFDRRIIDPRTAFAMPERFCGADLVAQWPVDEFAVRPLDRYCALVALTHDPKIDDYPIGAALKNDCFYVGALGSRKTHAARLERLRREGFQEAELARIHGPVGLAIGASNPAEIAVAILAEIILALHQPPQQGTS